MQNLRVIAFLLLAAFATGCRAQTSMWAEKIAATVMKTYPDSIVVKKYVTHGPDQTGSIKQSGPATWNYEQGVVLKGFDQLWKETKNTAYFDYMKKMMDVFVRDDGTIRTYDLLEYNIDHVTPGRVLLSLYQETKHLKYKRAADLLRNQ
ncbi:MAG TPA: glycoside hydrolase family 88 protein, partial [Chryseosolibacter sp.]|nr:glycoside hydrolase family 88 protein [Chryseosolibacter sp.]